MLRSACECARRRALLGILCVVTLALCAPPVRAAVPEAGNFPAERFRLSLDRNGILDVEWAAPLTHLHWEVSLWGNWAHEPLVFYKNPGHAFAAAVVEDRVDLGLLGAVGLFDWLEVGFELPIVVYQKRPRTATNALTDVLAQLQTVGVGDLRIVPKLRLLNAAEHAVDLGLMLAFTAPTGLHHQYFGEPGFTFQPEVLLGRAWTGWRAALNAGVIIRNGAQFVNQVVGSEITARLGVAYRWKEVQMLPFEVGLDAAGAANLNHPFHASNQTSLEVRGNLGYELVDQSLLFVGGGFGVLHGWATPAWRVFLGGRYGFEPPPPPPPPPPAPLAPPPPPAPEPAPLPPPLPPPPADTDGDGLIDSEDVCPNQAGPVNLKGCPDPDRDNDLVPDRLDNCPDVAGPKENQGCPNKQKVQVRQGKLELLDKVFFDTGKDTIQRRSFDLLDNVAQVLNAHPEFKLIRVEGHTDNQGSAQKNQLLSQRRAKAVVVYLIKQSVLPTRLEAVGYGVTKPIATNLTADGRAENRRVEFIIVAGSPDAP